MRSGGFWEGESAHPLPRAAVSSERLGTRLYDCYHCSAVFFNFSSNFLKLFDIIGTSSQGELQSKLIFQQYGLQQQLLSLDLCLYHHPYRLSVRRDHILEDAYDQIMKEPAKALQRNRLEIQFTGEEG